MRDTYVNTLRWTLVHADHEEEGGTHRRELGEDGVKLLQHGHPPTLFLVTAPQHTEQYSGKNHTPNNTAPLYIACILHPHSDERPLL